MQVDRKLQFRFGKRIRELRTAKGYTQEEFALGCEIDRTYMSGIERGVRNPTLQMLSVLAKGLNTTIASLMDGVDTNS